MTKLGVSASDQFRGQGNNTKYCQTGLIELRLRPIQIFSSNTLTLSLSLSLIHTQVRADNAKFNKSIRTCSDQVY